MLSKKIAMLAAISMMVGSSAAVAQTAQPLSLNNAPAIQRAGASTDNASQLGSRGYGIYIIGAVVLGLIIYGIIELTKDDSPRSP
jgi:hypothetical protein